jgi:hypothetical protein
MIGLLLLALAQERPDPAELVRHAVRELVRMQEPGGEWPYEGVYRVQGKIPIGYRVGGTSIVAGTILRAAAPDDREARAAVDRGLAFVLQGLEDPLLQPSAEDAYDVRVWGHASALEFLCQVRAAKAAGERLKEAERWIPELVKTLAFEEIQGGGWNYASHRQHAAFVTAPVVQSLLWAKSQGFEVPAELFTRAKRALELSRAENGAFQYSGSMPEGSKDTRDGAAGSCARSAGAEATLVLLGGGSAS